MAGEPGMTSKDRQDGGPVVAHGHVRVEGGALRVGARSYTLSHFKKNDLVQGIRRTSVAGDTLRSVGDGLMVLAVLLLTLGLAGYVAWTVASLFGHPNGLHVVLLVALVSCVASVRGVVDSMTSRTKDRSWWHLLLYTEDAVTLTLRSREPGPLRELQRQINNRGMAMGDHIEGVTINGNGGIVQVGGRGHVARISNAAPDQIVVAIEAIRALAALVPAPTKEQLNSAAQEVERADPADKASIAMILSKAQGVIGTVSSTVTQSAGAASAVAAAIKALGF